MKTQQLLKSPLTCIQGAFFGFTETERKDVSAEYLKNFWDLVPSKCQEQCIVFNVEIISWSISNVHDYMNIFKSHYRQNQARMFESQFPCIIGTIKTVRKQTDSSCFTQCPTGGSRKQSAVAFRDHSDLTQQGVGGGWLCTYLALLHRSHG